MSSRSIPLAVSAAGLLVTILGACASPPVLTPTSPPPPVPAPLPTAFLTPTSIARPVQLSPPFVGPDGRLAYVQDGHLIIAGIDGRETVVAEGSVAHNDRAVLWSPGGRRLLYATEEEGSEKYHIWDGTVGEILHLDQEIPGFPPEHWTGQMTWSPGGERLLFYTSAYLEFPPPRPVSGLWALDVKKRHLWEAVGMGHGHIAAGMWISENIILYDRSCGPLCSLLSMVSIGPPARPLTITAELWYAGRSGIYALSPDRRYLAGVDFIDYDGDEGWPWRLQVVPLFGNLSPTLSAQPDIIGAHDLLWSPDGRRIACGAQALADHDEDGAYTILVNAMGTGATQVITGLLPRAWSPDGQLLAGTAHSDPGQRAPAVADVASGRIVILASDRPIDWFDLAWSPTGDHLAYSLAGPDAGGWRSLVMWDRATGEKRVLIHDDEPGRFTDLQWAPDGASLFFAQRTNQTKTNLAPKPVEAIWKARLDQEHPRRIAP